MCREISIKKKLVNKNKICFKTKKKITLFKNNFLLIKILNIPDCNQPFLKLLLLILHFPLSQIISEVLVT